MTCLKQGIKAVKLTSVMRTFPDAGELGIFCPACPQVGINIPVNWKADQNRWVYRRVVTADGNFKADHVRQKAAADDVWLSDGLGMTTRNFDYNTFLESAWDRSTVSVQVTFVPNDWANSVNTESTL